jgi:MoaA/NifB/PqqE/SkfB family radical SAM enzyme
MSRDFVERVIAAAVRESFKVAAIGGGEPLEALDTTLHAIRTANRSGMLTAVTTSGVGLTIDALRKLKQAGLDHIQLSLGDNRVNLLDRLPLLIRHADTTVGINFLLSPRWIPRLEEIVNVLDRDGINQVTLLLPKGKNVTRFTRNEFMHYFEKLMGVQSKAKHITILIDCLTHRILTGQCNSQGCTIFPNGDVAKCAFHPYRLRWRGESISEAIRLFPSDCPEVVNVCRLVEVRP